jgi:hypothetical protein
MNMEIAVIILGLFIVLLIVVIYKQGKIIKKKDKEIDELTSVVYVVTRCEEHSDYVEEVFFDKVKAEEYCNKFNQDENNYQRDITEIKPTL